MRSFNIISEKIKFSRDKYAVLQVRWHEYVLKSEEVTKLFHDSFENGDIIRSMVSCYI